MGSDYFKGTNTAAVFEKGTFLMPGNYHVEVERCLVKETRKSGPAFIVELRILETSNPAHQIGQKVTWFQSLRDGDVSRPALKAFIYAVCGQDYSKDPVAVQRDFDPKIEGILESAVKDNGLKGFKVRVQTSMKKTTRGLDFTQHNWAVAQ